MRYVFIAAALALTTVPLQAGPGDIPLVAIGLPFAPESPRPVAPTHPLYHSIEIGEIEGLPSTVGSSALNFIAAAKRSSINAGLRESFERMNMLAPKDSKARGRLIVSWGGSHTPFRIATSNAATATLHYRLVRIDNGHILFERDITTSMKGSGNGDAGMRDNGIVRAAIASNFASAAYCLDHTALGKPPADCALVPQFSVTVTRVYNR
ncbi:hypothetical protein EDF56_101627 [Novosphingobium sp. PhB165]|uniref:hypothetical protein n=1 Tax=Novosphingobium sp. PhB165 TaxID=2485105 RepID=UPI0010475B34|nr:hypothetical protein [Novosphingobium sp. PhB165]TCM21950.1 hypothetical protein EDF56_101627 [Novosphingobium sp. PhB165]